jgi:hypothetical protein
MARGAKAELGRVRLRGVSSASGRGRARARRAVAGRARRRRLIPMVLQTEASPARPCVEEEVAGM